jgi:hypothetical protein
MLGIYYFSYSNIKGNFKCETTLIRNMKNKNDSELIILPNNVNNEFLIKFKKINQYLSFNDVTATLETQSTPSTFSSWIIEKALTKDTPKYISIYRETRMTNGIKKIFYIFIIQGHINSSCRYLDNVYDGGRLLIGYKGEKGVVVQIDSDDTDLLKRFSWRVNDSGYVVTSVQRANLRWGTDKLHRVLLGLSLGDGKEVDHVNGDPLDNRRVNLRVCSHSENLMNQKCAFDSYSGFKGVSYRRGCTKFPYMAYIYIRKGNKPFRECLGNFATAKEAALAYNRRAQECFGAFARCNVV